MYHNLFTYSFIDGHLGRYLDILALMISAVTNMCVYMYLFEYFSVLLSIHLQVELQDYIIILCLNF